MSEYYQSQFRAGEQSGVAGCLGCQSIKGVQKHCKDNEMDSISFSTPLKKNCANELLPLEVSSKMSPEEGKYN